MKRTIWTSILMTLSALSVPNAYANTNSSTELDAAQGVEVLFINSQKQMDEPFMLTTGSNQIVLRIDTMLGRGEQRGNFTSAPYILTLDVNGGELEIDGPKLKDVPQARKVLNPLDSDPLVKLKSREIDLRAEEEMRKREEAETKANMDALRLLQSREIASEKLEQDDEHAKLRASISLAKDGIKQMKAVVKDS